MLFKDLYNNFVTNKISLSRKTLRNYDIYYRHYFASFAAMDCCDITPAFVADIFADWRQRCPQKVYKIKKYLHAILEYGVDIWPANPTAKIKLPKPIPKECPVLSKDEIGILLESNAEQLYYTELLMLVMTGIRSAELRGLQWKDVDLNHGTITIQRTYDHGEVSTPKTSRSYRTISIPDCLVNQLGKLKQTDKWVFLGRKKTPISSSSTLRAHIDKCWAKAGLPHLKVHSFRHMHATYLLEQGASLKAIEQRMGWSSATVLLLHYAHVSADEKRKVDNIIQNIAN